AHAHDAHAHDADADADDADADVALGRPAPAALRAAVFERRLVTGSEREPGPTRGQLVVFLDRQRDVLRTEAVPAPTEKIPSPRTGHVLLARGVDRSPLPRLSHKTRPPPGRKLALSSREGLVGETGFPPRLVGGAGLE